MKLLPTAAVAAALVLVASAAQAQPQEQDPPSRVARLNLIDGRVSLQPASADDWSAASLNYPLTGGDHLYTDTGSRAELRIGPNAIRLGMQTNFGFLNLDDRIVQTRLTEGALNLRVRSLSDTDAWEVDTPNGAITLLRAGDYRIDTDPERNATMVTVRAGDAEVTANGQAFPVHARQTAYFAGDAGQPPQVQEANPADEFDRFCLDRDRREDALPPPRYVSRDMIGYEDLEGYGSWTVMPDYGPVWRPRVMLGWAPYRFGHWAWVEPWGWTWIDDAPWGFAPFHYGRWALIGGGWAWCPGPTVVARPVYAPALVAFVGGSNWSVSLRLGGGGGGGVAWFPLGPREVYMPSYHVSNTYVRQVNVTNVTNVTNINVTNVNVNRTYVNQSVPGAVTAVSRADFSSSAAVHRVAVNVPPGAVASAPVSGTAAAIAPTRANLGGQQPALARPRADYADRQVMAKTAPPPAPVPFAARQQALQRDPGRPVDPGTLQTLQQRRQDAGAASRPLVRPATTPAQSTPAGAARQPGTRSGWPQQQQPAQQQQPQQQVQPQPQSARPAGGLPRQGQPGQPPAQPGQPPAQQQQQPPASAQPQNATPRPDRMSTRPPSATPGNPAAPPRVQDTPQRPTAPPAAEQTRPQEFRPQRPAAPPAAEQTRPQEVRPQRPAVDQPPAPSRTVAPPPQVERREAQAPPPRADRPAPAKREAKPKAAKPPDKEQPKEQK